MTQEQHYVSQVYLQRFAISKNGSLWGLKIRNLHKKQYPKPILYNKSEVCKLPDLYKIKDLENIHGYGINNTNFIETDGFGYETKELTEIFDVMEKIKPVLISSIIKFLIIIFSIKRRNPKYIKLFLNNSNFDPEEFVEKEVNKMQGELSTAGLGDLAIDFDKLKREQKVKLRDKNYLSDLHKRVLLDTQGLHDVQEKQRIFSFISYQFTLLKAHPKTPFITSDNPGFTLKDGNKVYNLELGYTQSLFFPLSAIYTLQIDFKEDPDFSPQLLVKRIPGKQASKDLINLINVGTICNCNENVYGSNPDALSIAFELWKIHNNPEYK